MPFLRNPLLFVVCFAWAEPAFGQVVSPLDGLDGAGLTPSERKELPLETVAVLRGSGKGWILDCSFAQDGKLLALSKNDGTIALWNLELGAVKELQILSLDDVKGPIYHVRFSPDGKYLASVHGMPGNHVQIWQWSGARMVPAMAASKPGRVEALAFHPTKPIVVFGTNLGTPFEIGERELKQLPFQFRGANSNFSFSPKGNMFASVYFTPQRNGPLYGSEVRFWNLGDNTAEEQVTIRTNAHIKSMAFTPDGRSLATGSVDFQVRLWNGASEPPVMTASFAMKAWPRHLRFTPDGKRLIAFSSGNEIMVWNKEKDAIEKSWTFTVSRDGTFGNSAMYLLLSAPALAPDGRHIAFSNHTPNAVILRLPHAALAK